MRKCTRDFLLIVYGMMLSGYRNKGSKYGPATTDLLLGAGLSPFGNPPEFAVTTFRTTMRSKNSKTLGITLVYCFTFDLAPSYAVPLPSATIMGCPAAFGLLGRSRGLLARLREFPEAAR